MSYHLQYLTSMCKFHLPAICMIWHVPAISGRHSWLHQTTWQNGKYKRSGSFTWWAPSWSFRSIHSVMHWMESIGNFFLLIYIKVNLQVPHEKIGLILGAGHVHSGLSSLFIFHLLCFFFRFVTWLKNGSDGTLLLQQRAPSNCGTRSLIVLS